MKFENRQEQRFVCEKMNSLLAPLMYHLSEETKEAVTIALGMLNNAEIEEEKHE